MKIRTDSITGAALDWAVAKCEGVEVTYLDDGITRCLLRDPSGRFSPSTDWSQGGPIIEREQISVIPFDDRRWEARCKCTVQRSPARFIERRAPTPLVAAMRCFVSSRLGDEVDIPEELK